MTAKAETAEPFSQARYGFAAYMVDCALLLSRQHKDSASERDVTVLKYRGSSFSENKSPLVIGPSGIEVAEEPTAHAAARATTERLSTGVSRLDTMLSGGYLRASSVLVTGLPGTAKSSLGGAFVRAACGRRERALYVSFDEQGPDIIRNLTSINVNLGPFVQSGQLRMLSLQAFSARAEVQLMRIRGAIREQSASCVVVDPMSALSKSSDSPIALEVIARFIHWARLNSITLVCTSLLSDSEPHREATDVGVSTLCDTWIHLTYAQQGGERNRALTIIKSRGTNHSNQVRELLLTDKGIAIADVYQVGGEVLMGTLRWQEENRQRDEERRLQAAMQKKRIELERKQADIQARSEALRRELEINDVELAETKCVEDKRLVQGAARRQELQRQRAADREQRKARAALAPLRLNRRTSKKDSS
jgi:circadian clock protein KaiC